MCRYSSSASSRHVAPPGRPLPQIVLFLSSLQTDRGGITGGVPDALPLSSDLIADLAEMVRRKPGVRWAWEMPLRGLAHHRFALEGVTLFCSRESLPQAHLFAALLRGRYKDAFPRLMPDKVRLLVGRNGRPELIACPDAPVAADANPTHAWDFEEYEELYRGLSGMLDRLGEERVTEKQVVVDVTGGQKPNSIVGALLTVNRGAIFQYVQTGGEHKVIAYDLVTDATD